MLEASYRPESGSHRRVRQGNESKWFFHPTTECNIVSYSDLVFLDGIGLACGIFEHLLNLKNAPKVIAATHFHEIFEQELLPSRPRLQLGHMEVKVCEDVQEAEDQVTYLYKFVLQLFPPRNRIERG